MDTSNRLMITFFVVIITLGLLHAALFPIAPFKTNFSTLPAFKVLATFWVCFGIAIALVMKLLPRRGSGIDNKDDSCDLKNLLTPLASMRFLSALAIISLIGLTLHIYSKHALTEIRPVTCMFEIRFAWREVPHELQPLSVRLASMLGHVLTHMALPIIIITGWALNSKIRGVAARPALMTFFIISLIIGVIYAWFLGSRNALLTFVIISAFGSILGLCTHQITTKSISKVLKLLLIPATFGIAFAFSVFSDRMFCGTEGQFADPRLRSERSISYLSGFEDEIAILVQRPDENSLQAASLRFCPMCGPSILYLSHGIINLSQVIGSGTFGEPVLSKTILWMIQRLGLNITEYDTGEPVLRVYGRGGLPLAGSVYHDFSWAGVIGSGAFFGVLVGILLRLLSFHGVIAGISVALLACSFYSIGISFMFTASGVMFFPFLLFSNLIVFGLAPMLQKLKLYVSKNW